MRRYLIIPAMLAFLASAAMPTLAQDQPAAAGAGSVCQKNAPSSAQAVKVAQDARRATYSQLCRASESAARLFDVIDRGGSGRLTRADLDTFAAALMSADTGKKGYITREDMIAAANRSLRNKMVCKLLFLYDANKDGTISPAELSREAGGLIGLDVNRDGIIDGRDLELIGQASCMSTSVRFNSTPPRRKASFVDVPMTPAPFTIVPVTSGPGATTPNPGASTPSAGATTSRPGSSASSAGTTTPSPGVVPPNPGVITPSPPPSGEPITTPSTTTPVPGTASVTGLGEESYLVPSGAGPPPAGPFRGTVNQEISGNLREPLTLTPGEETAGGALPVAPSIGSTAPVPAVAVPEGYPGDEGELYMPPAEVPDVGGYGRPGY